jgi:hypothetical protein
MNQTATHPGTGPWHRTLNLFCGSALRTLTVIVFVAMGAWAASGIATSSETQSASGFETANRLYEQAKYPQAAASYRDLLRDGKSSAALWYNLGNALFKSGEFGQAIAAYLRAERLDPRDPDIRANLRFAREQARGPAPPGGFWERYLGQFTLNEWTLATATPMWLALLLLSFAQWQPARWPAVRPWVFVAVGVACFLATCTAVVYQQDRNTRVAVITSDTVEVRHGPLEESQAAFNLHDGAETLVLDEKDGWLRVNAGAMGTGWIAKQAAVVVP